MRVRTKKEGTPTYNQRTHQHRQHISFAQNLPWMHVCVVKKVSTRLGPIQVTLQVTTTIVILLPAHV